MERILMKYFRFLFLTLFLTCAILGGSYGFSREYAATIDTRSWEEVVQYAREHLPLEGQLRAKEDGFTYVKVDDEYIHTLFPMLGLEEEGYTEPPYFRSATAPGAHISVFYEDEDILPDELGQVFHFILRDIVIVHPSRAASYAVLQVESTELEALRKKYGLSPKLHGHEFHISLAKKTIRKNQLHR